MAVDTPAGHVYTGNGNTRVFPIPTRIIGDDYVRIELDGVYLSDRTQWDIVNNSIIFITAPANGTVVNIKVATSEEALAVLGSSTNVDIVATNMTDVNTVANNINNIDTVATNINNVNIVAGNISKVNTVATNIVGINQIVDNLHEILSADESASTATTKASEASASATSASTSATSASTSASQALTSRNQAETFKNSASTSATTATTKASEASASATTATTKASEASASATSASTSASQALTSRNQAETFAQQAQASASSVDANNIVHRSGDESIGGVKTFSSSPIVPTPTSGTQAVNKDYVDNGAGATFVANDSRVKTALNATGSAPTYACRAWVNFNGTGTVAISSSGNVSSITDNGTGDYTLNFATAMPDANYNYTFGLRTYQDGYAGYAPAAMQWLSDTQSTSAMRFRTMDSNQPAASRDFSTICVSIHR